MLWLFFERPRQIIIIIIKVPGARSEIIILMVGLEVPTSSLRMKGKSAWNYTKYLKNMSRTYLFDV